MCGRFLTPPRTRKRGQIVLVFMRTQRTTRTRCSPTENGKNCPVFSIRSSATHATVVARRKQGKIFLVSRRTQRNTRSRCSVCFLVRKSFPHRKTHTQQRNRRSVVAYYDRLHGQYACPWRNGFVTGSVSVISMRSDGEMISSSEVLLTT